MTTAAVAVLRAYADGDAVALSWAMRRLAEALPEAAQPVPHGRTREA